MFSSFKDTFFPSDDILRARDIEILNLWINYIKNKNCCSCVFHYVDEKFDIQCRNRNSEVTTVMTCPQYKYRGIKAFDDPLNKVIGKIIYGEGGPDDKR